MRLGVSTLPPLPRDQSDRNRTSPFAFTGNKFEFRAVGASQSIAYPNTILNTMVAESLDFMATEIEKRGGTGDRREVIQTLVRETLTKHRRILFSGDNYTAEWVAEAERRGLHNLKDTPSALTAFSAKKNIDLFDRYKVFSPRETESRANVLNQMYVHRVSVEAATMKDVASTLILPAAIEFQKFLADAITSTATASKETDLKPQREVLSQVATAANRLKSATDALARARHEAEETQGGDPIRAAAFRDRVIPAMTTVRELADLLETLVADDLWPLPTYQEMLFIK
jgi:glutamine synthetase